MSHPRTRSAPEAGKALILLLGVVALAAIAFLFFGEQLGLTGGSGDADGGTSIEEGDLLDGTGEGTTTIQEADAMGAADLEGLYGDGDRGAIQMRLFWVKGKRPVVGQSIGLVSRRGMDIASVDTDPKGMAVFSGVAPDRGYNVLIQGEGFKAVRLGGIKVRKGETTRLDDIYIGENIVMRGRVVDRSGRPLPNASVSVYQGVPELQLDGVMFTMANMAFSVPNPLEESDTDSSGYFTMSTLDDGVYRLEARRSGYRTAYKTDVAIRTDRDAGIMTLMLLDGARLSGTVTNDSGEPIANARVMAFLETGGRMGRFMGTPQREITTTNEKGEYVLDTLGREMRYRIGVVAQGYAGYFQTRARTIDMNETMDFVLPQGGTIEGVVTAKQDGAPVAGAVIAVSVGNMMGREPSNAVSTAMARTDDEGRFRVDGVKAGPVSSAQIKAPGYVTESRSQWTGNQLPDVKPGETLEVAVELMRGGTVRGIVKTQDGKPIADATVILDSRAAFWAGTASGTSDANGEYVLQGVPAGEYGVVASATGFAPSDPQASRVTVDEAGNEQVADVVLSAAGTVTGKVLDQNGEPVAGISLRVVARAEEAENGGRGRNNRRGGGFGRGGPSMAVRMLENTRAVRATSDVNGAYELEGVAAGRWVVVGEGKDFVRSESKPFRIEPGDVEKAEVKMLPGAVITGRVLDDRGTPVKDARIRVGTLSPDRVRTRNLSAWRADRDLEAEVYTPDATGAFRIEGIAPGTILLKVEADDHVTYYKRNIVLEAGQMKEGVAVSLDRGQTVKGIVRGADGQPIRGAYVAVTKRRDPMQRQDQMEEGETAEDVEPNMGAQASEDGTFTIRNVPPGEYSVVVWWAAGHQGYRSRGSETPNMNAIKQGVMVPTNDDIEFRLDAAAPRGQGDR